MRAKFLILFLLLLFRTFSFAQNSFTTEQYKQDFNYFWSTINDEYCYFAKKQTDWQKVKEIYTPAIDNITSRDQFVGLLEKALYEIYDHHAILNTNTADSRKLVPSGTDLWAEYINGIPTITEVRRSSAAQTAGIVAGMEVVSINDMPVQTAVEKFLPRALTPVTNEAKSFALRLLLAGSHNTPRKFTLKYHGSTKEYSPGSIDNNYIAKIEAKLVGNIGYIKINDCLYDNELVPAFDSIMQIFRNTTGLILDLRETPSGGNTTVARAILGWFINKDHVYQKHEYYAEEKVTGVKRSWQEIVSPRKGKYYSKPLTILCDHWTGSIAEGIVIGFDAMKRPNTKIIGTEMARLLGAVYSFEMPNTKIRFTFPAERLYHVNGTPREQYVPPVFIDWKKKEEKPGTDLWMLKALGILNKE